MADRITDDIKAQLRMDADDTAEDSLLGGYIMVASDEGQQLLNRAIGEQTLVLYLDKFSKSIMLPMPPLVDLVSVKYIDVNGDEQTLDTSKYYLDDKQEPAWLLPAVGEVWPQTQVGGANCVAIEYTAGYTPESCPEPIKLWIKMRVGTMHVNREAHADRPVVEHGFAERLVDRYKVIVV